MASGAQFGAFDLVNRALLTTPRKHRPGRKHQPRRKRRKDNKISSSLQICKCLNLIFALSSLVAHAIPPKSQPCCSAIWLAALWSIIHSLGRFDDTLKITVFLRVLHTLRALRGKKQKRTHPKTKLSPRQWFQSEKNLIFQKEHPAKNKTLTPSGVPIRKKPYFQKEHPAKNKTLTPSVIPTRKRPYFQKEHPAKNKTITPSVVPTRKKSLFFSK